MQGQTLTLAGLSGTSKTIDWTSKIQSQLVQLDTGSQSCTQTRVEFTILLYKNTTRNTVGQSVNVEHCEDVYQVQEI